MGWIWWVCRYLANMSVYSTCASSWYICSRQFWLQKAMLFFKILWPSQEIPTEISNFLIDEYICFWYFNFTRGGVLVVQPYLVPLHGRLPPHDKLIASNRVPLHAKYRFASWIITDITHHCNVPSVVAQPTVTPWDTSSLPAGNTQFCNQQASSSNSSSNFSAINKSLCVNNTEQTFQRTSRSYWQSTNLAEW